MSKIFRFLLILTALCPALPTSALSGQESQAIGRMLTLQDAIRMALTRGPEVSLAQAEVLRSAEALRARAPSGLMATARIAPECSPNGWVWG